MPLPTELDHLMSIAPRRSCSVNKNRQHGDRQFVTFDSDLAAQDNEQTGVFVSVGLLRRLFRQVVPTEVRPTAGQLQVARLRGMTTSWCCPAG